MKFEILILVSFIAIVTPLYTQNGQTIDSCQGPTFIKAIGEPGVFELGIALCPSEDGNLYVTGSTADSALLLKVNPGGDILWARAFDFFPGFDRITHLSHDSDGMLIGCGNSNINFNGVKNSFFFRYNPHTDVFLWIVQPSFFAINAGYVGGIKEKTVGGNFFVSYQSPVLPGGGIIMEIERQSGTEIPGSSWRYNWGSSNFLPSFVIHGSHLYAAGFSATGQGGSPRQSLLCIDTSNGNVIWSQLNHVPTDIPAHLTGEDLIIDDNAVISVYSGNEQSTAIFPTAAFLQKTTLDGERVWLKKYDFTAFVEERATELVRVSDGYIIFGQSRTHNQSQGGLFILKTELDGEIMWARIYRYSDYDYVFTANRDQELLELDGSLYFTAFSEDSEGGTDLILGKLNSEGFVSDSCHFIQSTQVESYTVVSTDSTSPQLVFQNLDIETTTPQPTPLTQAYSLQAFQNICEHSCTEDVGCDIKINGCLTFELLNITADSEGNNTYRMRVTNSCTDQHLSYIAIQIPDGTVSVQPQNGSTYTSPGGNTYTVRNPNFSPFYSIRFKSQQSGIGNGASDIFDYTIKGQSQPAYIQIFARLTPGPSFGAHLNVFNCPLTFNTVQNRDQGMQITQSSIFPNPVSTELDVNLPEKSSGKWTILGIHGSPLQSGYWNEVNEFLIPVSNLQSGLYFLQLVQEGLNSRTHKFIKIE